MAISARDTGYQLVHFLRKTINLNTTVQAATHTTLGTTIEVGGIPAGAVVVGDGLYLSLHASGTTNTLDVGYSSDSLSTLDVDAYASALSIKDTTGLGRQAFDELGNVAGSANKRAIDTTVTATWKGTATTGVFDLIVQYVLDK